MFGNDTYCKKKKKKMKYTGCCQIRQNQRRDSRHEENEEWPWNMGSQTSFSGIKLRNCL